MDGRCYILHLLFQEGRARFLSPSVKFIPYSMVLWYCPVRIKPEDLGSVLLPDQIRKISMVKSILIVNGAIRVNGNTDILVNKIIEGSRNMETDITVFNLREKRISDCRGCYQCMEESTCSLQDDMTEIRGVMERSDLMVLASPLYWCGVTGLMKTFIDRLFFYYHPKTKPLISAKKALIITPMNQKNVAHESEVLVEFYNRLFNCLKVKIVEMVFFSDIMGKRMVLDRPDYLDRAYSIGKNLINW